MKTAQQAGSTEEQTHRQPEFPANGTSLNPLDESWGSFDKQSTGIDQPASTE
ncbi:hypothetical protein [Brevibacillus reuszeri]|uniref:hypothetical protein n=1 Tax=Brevibacillus reuszeri TaxID=54915 RepID=UPI0028A0626C|nr:hypothetical protein [Brevibacillus reuszeri]